MFNSKKCEFCFFKDTLYRWYTEGLPTSQNIEELKINLLGDIPQGTPAGWGPVNIKLYPHDEDVAKYFDFNLKSAIVPLDFTPFRRQKIIEENEDYKLYFDEYGIKKKELKKSVAMPFFIEYYVKKRDDFEVIKSKYTDNFEERLDKNWVEDVEDYRKNGYTIWLYNDYWGFFAVLRQLIGVENLSLMFFDDPAFIKHILRFYTDYVIRFWDYILKKVEVDYVLIWEDMAYRQTSLISPAMFKEFLLPYYKELTSFLKKTNIKKILVDSDGNINSLIQLWIEGGVDGIYPMEPQAGMDVVEVRKNFPDLLIGGGMDKRALAKTKKNIDLELEKAEYVIKTGGYIPFADHCIPNDVSWENFKYYRNDLNKIIDKYKNFSS